MKIVLLSATAPPKLESHLLKNFGMHLGGTAFIRCATNRPEIGLHTICLGSLTPKHDLVRLVQALELQLKDEERILVFFASVAELQAFVQGFPCPVFHTSLPLTGIAAKESNLRRWDSGECNVMACTSAFGSGVDRAHVRFVVIYEPAYGLISTLQMAGRAGRDGKESHVFFATSQQTGPSPRSTQKTIMVHELGEVVHKAQCKVYQTMVHMDGDQLAKTCDEIRGQVRCDICAPEDEMHQLAVRAVKGKGKKVNQALFKDGLQAGGRGSATKEGGV